MEIRYIDEELGIDGTCDELMRWSWQYSSDYSNAALLQMYEIGARENHPKKLLPLLELRRRERAEDELPYEQIVASAIYYGENPNYSATTKWGELEIRTENDKVLLSVIGTDDNGSFTAANAMDKDLFMSGCINDRDTLEKLFAHALAYGKEYDNEDC